MKITEATLQIKPNARFGRLTILSETSRNHSGHKQYKYRCDCGMIGLAVAQAIVRKNKQVDKSCGCARLEFVKRGTHNKTDTSTYMTWEAMTQRCCNPKHESFPRYGGRGIIICPEWIGRGGFERFLKDMGERPLNKTIERINNDESYNKNNCYWATSKEQARNRVDNKWITHDGETKILKDWAMQANLTESGLQKRLDRGLTFQNAITQPKIR